MTPTRIASLLALSGLLAGSLGLSACGDEPADSKAMAVSSGPAEAPTSSSGTSGTAAIPATQPSETAATPGAGSGTAVAQATTDTAPAPSSGTGPASGAATDAAAATTGVAGAGTSASAAAADAGSASAPAAGASTAGGTAGAGGSALYKVVDGTKVDPGTLKGFRTWRAAACDRCHGANQEGMVGPSLINSLKVLTKEQFVTTVTEGRLEKGMPAFKTSSQVMENIDHLYAYLKGRSDGAITSAKVTGIE